MVKGYVVTWRGFQDTSKSMQAQDQRELVGIFIPELSLLITLPPVGGLVAKFRELEASVHVKGAEITVPQDLVVRAIAYADAARQLVAAEQVYRHVIPHSVRHLLD
jgi:hypothetical protein